MQIQDRKFQCVCVCICTHRRRDSIASLEWATKYNPMYESDVTTGYNHYYQRYPEPPVHSSASAEVSTDFSTEEIQHIYENIELTKEVRSLRCTYGGRLMRSVGVLKSFSVFYL